ncbi:MAG: hypothetical protein ACYS21_03280 [Planctomycetota bacterium]
MNEDKPKRISAVPGLAVVGLVVTGIVGIVAAFSDASTGDGLALVASAIAFSSMLYVAYK